MPVIAPEDRALSDRIKATPKLELGAKIEEARTEMGYSLDYLGELCDGMYRQTLIDYQKGRYRPSPQALRKIAKHTKQPLEFFLNGSGEAPFPADGRGDAEHVA